MSKKAKPNKGGRPPKSPEQVRSLKVEFSVTAAERQELVDSAGDNLSKWCRDTLLRVARRK
jgi:hypothetical protein